MNFNDAGLAILKEFEAGPQGGPALVSYLDITGTPTIGYGHIKGVKLRQTITPELAEGLLLDDVAEAEKAVSRELDGLFVPTENQFSALVCLVFNIGAKAWRGSTVLRLLAKNTMPDIAGAANAITFWNKGEVHGQKVIIAGLVRRRKAEKTLFLLPDLPAP